MDTTHYLEMFLDESREHLQAVNEQLLKLEDQPQDLKIVNEIFRSAHTLKGMAATMGFEDIASLTHQMENVLDLIRNNELAVSTNVIDVCFEAVSVLEEMVREISEGGDGKQDVSLLVTKLKQMGKQPNDNPSLILSKKDKGDFFTPIQFDEYQTAVMLQAKEQGYQVYQLIVRLSDDCLLKGARIFMVFEALDGLGEVIKTIPLVDELEEGQFEQDVTIVFVTNDSENTIQQKIINITDIQSVGCTAIEEIETIPKNDLKRDKITEKQKDSYSVSINHSPTKTIRVNTERIDHLMNLFEEMVIDRGRLEDIAQTEGNHELSEAVEHLTRVSQDLQNMMLSLRMVPIEKVFNRFPKMVRGLAKDLEKKINLQIVGAETELDRTVIDEIGDPLVHLIRNSIDHGIEPPEKRKAQGKPEEGTILLRAFHSGNHVMIEIQDDGAGINREKVIEKAVKSGLFSLEHAESLIDAEVNELIFSSGFSTADQVSDLSGRGVGLDVVRTKIESLGGHILIDSSPGEGSTFSIQLPLTLSILSTLLVSLQDDTYAVPLSSIEETVLLPKESVFQAHNQSVMDFRNKIIPLVDLRKAFELNNQLHDHPLIEKETIAIVIVRKGDKLAGLIVDSFIGQKEVVLKSLGSYLGQIDSISGATILGDGRVSLIIDPNTLIK
ncbi:chemotaxis protein CheA [Bacillus dakarensis]|uniref:chemotaxis protein CheA n=1 Tax=Robertmurraya dakarensis TaxID=1926278 RepID=UPI0009811F39|nr:chemotaxis protein CheA [Bacillus dakarensis]